MVPTKTFNDLPAMILAAGRGERMRPLTDVLPKPLLQVRGKALLDYHLEGMKNAGFKQIVVNHSWLGEKIVAHVDGGSRFGMNISCSSEPSPLETAGGIKNALGLLNPLDYFFVINGDTFVPDFPFQKIAPLVEFLRKSSPSISAYLFMTANPEHHLLGDFYLRNGLISTDNQRDQENIPDQKKLTFSGAGIYHKSMFKSLELDSKYALAPLLKNEMSKQLVLGEFLNCQWHDVGTPQRLESLNQR